MAEPQINWRQLAQFLSERLAPGQNDALEEDTPLLSSGLLDSFTLVELMVHVQKTWDVRIPSDRLTVEQFDTLRHITDLVESLRSVPDDA